MRERLQEIQLESYAWIRTSPIGCSPLHLVAGPHGNGSWDQTTDTLTWKAAFHPLHESRAFVSPGSITVVPSKRQKPHGVVVHLGIHKTRNKHLFEVQPCLYVDHIEYQPWRVLSTLFKPAGPAQLSDNLSHDWLFLSKTNILCASVKSDLVMDKRISVIDIWAVYIKESISLLSTLTVLTHTTWTVGSMMGQPVFRRHIFPLLWDICNQAWPGFCRLITETCSLWLLFLLPLLNLTNGQRGNGNSLVERVISLGINVVEAIATIRILNRSQFRFLWQQIKD